MSTVSWTLEPARINPSPLSETCVQRGQTSSGLVVKNQTSLIRSGEHNNKLRHYVRVIRGHRADAFSRNPGDSRIFHPSRMTCPNRPRKRAQYSRPSDVIYMARSVPLSHHAGVIRNSVMVMWA